MSGGEEIRKIGGSLSLSVGDFTNGAGVSLALEGNGARNTGGISDPGGERDAFARVPERSVRFNRSIARLKIDRRKSVTVLLDYTDSIGQQRPNPAQLDEALERLIAVLDLLHKNKHVSQVYLWGTFPLELRVRAMALRREYPKLQPPVSSPLKNVLMANRDGVVGKKRISRTYLDGIFAESALSHNLVVIDNGETRWPFHLAGLAQVVIPKGAEDVVDCVRQLVHKLNHAYEQTAVIDPASSDDIAPFAVALRQRVAQLISEGKERATLADLRPRIHTRDLADFLHPDRIRFVFKDPELHGFVAVILELEAMGSLPVTPEATGSPPVSLAQAEGDGGGINGPTRTGGDDGGGPFRDPPYPSLSRFSTDLPRYYDPLNGLLTLRGGEGEKTLTIDLGIPMLPPPAVEAHSQYLIRILWRPEGPESNDPSFQQALVLKYDPESGRVEIKETVKEGEANDKKVCDIKRALSAWLEDNGEEFVRQHLFGLKERALTGILPLPLPSGATRTVDLNLDDFKVSLTVYRIDRMNFRWGEDPENNYELNVTYRYFRDSWGGIDHGLSVEANTNRDPEADNKPSFSYGGGARQPDDVRGLKEAIDRFIARAGRETIPKMAESHYADDVAPNTARYEGLGDLYKPLPKPDERTYQKILHGIHRWADLELFVREALRNAKGEEAVEVEIELYNFRALEVPKAFLARAAKLAARYPGHPLTLVAHGDRMDLPFVYRFDGQGVHASSNEKNEQAIAFWGEAPLDPSKIFRAGDNEPAEVYQHRLLDRALRDTASAPAEERPMDRGVFLSGVLENYNRLAKEWNARQGKGLPAVALIKDNRRTEIDARIQGLINHYRARAKEIAEERGLDVPAGALWWDPVTTTLRNYPINDRPENHLVVVGGGAMGAAMAEIVRRRIDRGLLPLDFRVTVVETAPALNWEIHTEGTNTYAFGKDRPVNPPARRAFYYTPVPAEEVMNRRGADVVVEATKAGDFVKDKKRKESAEGLARHSPAMLSPTKSFVPGSLIPYLEVYDYYVSLGYPDLAASQLVFGGYVSAPDVFGDLEVYPVIAGESPEAVAKAKRIFGEEGIEYLVGKEWAVFVQMAGAMKNPATYWATYGIASRVFGEQTPTYSELNPLLEKAKEDNVRLVEETIARIAPEVGLETEGLSSPYGVKMDIQKCLPPDLEALFEIRKRFNDEVLATGNIAALDNIIKDIIGKRYRHRLGTRNAMDGALDALIASAYSRLKPDVTFAQFYDDHYPADWKKSPQEGRNGVDHLMAFADEHCLSLPGWVYEAWNLYHAKEIREGKMAEKVVAPVPVQVFPATISAGHAEGAPLLASAGSESAAMAAPSDGATAGAKLLGIGGLVFVLQGNPLSDLMAEQIVAGPSSLGPVAVYEPPVGLAPAFSAVAKPAVYSPFNSAGAFSIQSPSLGVWGADPAWGATSASILAAVPSLIVSAPGAVAPGISFAPMPAFVP